MVIYEIDTVMDVISGHRIIFYYLVGGKYNTGYSTECQEIKLHQNLELVMEMLTKKNDDLLIIKVLKDSAQFKHFEELYKPIITGTVTVFAINNKGIPIACEQVNNEGDIQDIIKSLCSCCKLNQVPITEQSKNASKTNLELGSFPIKVDSRAVIHDQISIETLAPEVGLPKTKATALEEESSLKSDLFLENKSTSLEEVREPIITELQIRLPNGNRDKQKFDKDAMLSEVGAFIAIKYNLRNFDLKTYNHEIFTEGEYEMSLKDLDLYPNGVIIVINKNVESFRPNNYGGVIILIQHGFQQLKFKTISLFSYVQGLLFNLLNSFFVRRGNNSSQTQNKITSSQGQNDSTSSSQKRQKKTISTKFGNIHTLHRNDESDDENNRYNGNSTQQK